MYLRSPRWMRSPDHPPFSNAPDEGLTTSDNHCVIFTYWWGFLTDELRDVNILFSHSFVRLIRCPVTFICLRPSKVLFHRCFHVKQYVAHLIKSKWFIKQSLFISFLSNYQALAGRSLLSSAYQVAHSFYIELAQALITPQHFNPENFRGVVVIRQHDSTIFARLVNPSSDHVCNVQMTISVVFSFRFASFSSIDCALTTTWCLRLAQICLPFDEPAFST